MQSKERSKQQQSGKNSQSPGIFGMRFTKKKRKEIIKELAVLANDSLVTITRTPITERQTFRDLLRYKVALEADRVAVCSAYING